MLSRADRGALESALQSCFPDQPSEATHKAVVAAEKQIKHKELLKKIMSLKTNAKNWIETLEAIPENMMLFRDSGVWKLAPDGGDVLISQEPGELLIEFVSRCGNIYEKED